MVALKVAETVEYLAGLLAALTAGYLVGELVEMSEWRMVAVMAVHLVEVLVVMKAEQMADHLVDCLA